MRNLRQSTPPSPVTLQLQFGVFSFMTMDFNGTTHPGFSASFSLCLDAFSPLSSPLQPIFQFLFNKYFWPFVFVCPFRWTDPAPPPPQVRLAYPTPLTPAYYSPALVSSLVRVATFPLRRPLKSPNCQLPPFFSVVVCLQKSRVLFLTNLHCRFLRKFSLPLKGLRVPLFPHQDLVPRFFPDSRTLSPLARGVSERSPPVNGRY